VERRRGVGPGAAAAAGRELGTLVKITVGVSATIDVIEPDGVERSVGKMRRMVDERSR
jgi:phenylacetate-CoA ligase